MGCGAAKGLLFFILAMVWIVSPAAGDVPAAQFASRVSLNVGGGAIGLAAGDFNGDRRLDLAVGNNELFQAKIFYGQANGTLGTPTTLTLPSDIPSPMASGDLNSDGRTDLIYNNSGAGVAYGQVNNTFSPINHIAGGYKYVVVDLNGDGLADMVMTTGSTVTAYYGQVGGGFVQQSYLAGTNGLGIAVADFNGDGRKDIVTTNSDSTDSLTLMLALAGGGFSNTTLVGGRSESILTADFNHDGRPDIAYAVFGHGAGVKLGLSGGGFSATTFFATTDSALDITSGDFNHDGNVDLALVTTNFSTVSLLLGNGDGTFAPATNLFASANGSASIISGDFNGDGLDDLAVASASGPNVDIFYQVPEPGTAIPAVIIGIISALRRWPARRGVDKVLNTVVCTEE